MSVYETAWILCAVLAGVGIAVICWAVTLRGAAARPLKYRQKMLMRGGIQVRLDSAHIPLSADAFLLRSAQLGVPLGLGLAVVVGSVVLLPLGILAGALLTWTNLERKRDQAMIDYNRALAGACDTLRNAYMTTGSLSNALQAVIDYGNPQVHDDFLLALTAARQGEFARGLQTVADRRRSIIFDAVANALLRAEESSGAVGEMLERLAEATRQSVAAFESAMVMQINARSNVNWGAFGPWIVFGVFRAMSIGGTGLDGMSSFFATVTGNIVAGAAGLLTLGLHRWCFSIAQRDLAVPRIETSDPGSFVTGERPVAMPGFGERAPGVGVRMRQRPLGT